MRILIALSLFSSLAQATYIGLPLLGNPSWKTPVTNAAALPLTNNTIGDCRATKDTGVVYCWIGSWAAPAGAGTVTSVALSLPAIFSVSGSPVTTTGTLTGTLATQTANKVWASATSGGAATPAFRALVAADIPTGNLTSSTTGLTVTSGTAAVIGSGTALAIQSASGSQPGLLLAADWTTFNGKQAALTLGNLTASGGVTQTGGTGAIVGSGVAVACTASADGTTGCLTGSDHTSLTGLHLEQLDGQLAAPGNATNYIRAYAMYSGTINSIYIGTVSGTDTVAVKINGTNVTGLSAISVTSTPGTSTASAANTFVAGDQITLVTTSDSSAVNLFWSLKVTRN